MRGIHVAVIMDGNGRWANARGLPRVAGHTEGARVVRRIVEAAPDLGVGMLTLYAFSSDNWGRPSREVSGLMRLFRSYLAAETQRCVENDIRMSIIGRRDRLPEALRRSIDGRGGRDRGRDADAPAHRPRLLLARLPSSPPRRAWAPTPRATTSPASSAANSPRRTWTSWSAPAASSG
jgi:hypothetical protein